MQAQTHRVAELSNLRFTVIRALLVIIWAHVPLIACVAWFAGNSALVLGLGATVGAAAATFARFAWPPGSPKRIALGITLLLMVSLLLAATAGHPWQSDIHMYYFAALAGLATFCDRNVILTGAAFTAAHHLSLSLLSPDLVFGGGGDLGRVLLHAGILSIEAGILVWLTNYLAHMIRVNAAGLKDAEAARAAIEAAVAAREVAQQQAEQIRRTTMLDLSSRFEASVGHIVSAVASAATELKSTSEAMTTTAELTIAQAGGVGQASEEANRNVQTVGAATEELSASIAGINQQITRASTMIKDSVKQTTLSNEQVRGLTEAADKIGDVVKMISDIAGQTNLLALNATIEAARAGDAGKGFAVVASEVKALATQTAKATEEIAAQIKAIQDATQSSARLIQGVAETICMVEETTTTIAAAIEQQAAATLEISRSVSEAARGTKAVSQSIGGVNEAAQQTGAASGEVLTAADRLSLSGETLRAQVDTFIRDIRAA